MIQMCHPQKDCLFRLNQQSAKDFYSDSAVSCPLPSHDTLPLKGQWHEIFNPCLGKKNFRYEHLFAKILPKNECRCSPDCPDIMSWHPANYFTFEKYQQIMIQGTKSYCELFEYCVLVKSLTSQRHSKIAID